jgi:hypothetical protein
MTARAARTPTTAAKITSRSMLVLPVESFAGGLALCVPPQEAGQVG